jgi:Skp family chaperone for outer membrane proteins
MRRVAAWVIAGLLAVLPWTAVAQQETSFNIPPPILTIDQDRLFAETRAGASITAEIEARVAALAQENAQIEADLIQRERDLTQQRAVLPAAEFRELADDFDADVQRIRAEQDTKARAITAARDKERQDFIAEAADIISRIVVERGALIVLDQRDVFLSADSIDITDEAVERINAANASGTGD